MLEVKVTSLGPVRAKLIKKGMIYSPAHGDLAFSRGTFEVVVRESSQALPSKELAFNWTSGRLGAHPPS